MEKIEKTTQRANAVRRYVYAYSIFGDLICAWWIYLFSVMMKDLLFIGSSVAELSYIVWLTLLGPGTTIYVAAGFFLRKKERAEKARKILTVSAGLEIFFFIVPVVIYFITTIKLA